MNNAFDMKAWCKMRGQLQLRTKAVAVPEFAHLFKAGEPAEFEVRQLTGDEYARVEEERQKVGNLELLLNSGTLPAEAVQQIAAVLGLYSSNDIPANSARRIEALKIVFPEFERADIVQWNKFFPMVVWRLSETIFELTGQGAVFAEKKPVRSMATTESAI